MVYQVMERSWRETKLRFVWCDQMKLVVGNPTWMGSSFEVGLVMGCQFRQDHGLISATKKLCQWNAWVVFGSLEALFILAYALSMSILIPSLWTTNHRNFLGPTLNAHLEGFILSWYFLHISKTFFKCNTWYSFLRDLTTILLI